MESNSCFMEKKRIRGKDILRMDGLLPPTRRLPVCNAVTSASEKKKEKKWSIGGLLKRISSMRDEDSSSNEEEIVYCKRENRNSTKTNKQSDSIVLHPVKSICERRTESSNTVPENNIASSTESLNAQMDSLQCRNRDSSLEGLVRKIRKNKMKARVKAKRDQLCPNSSSDEDSHISNNSLTKLQLDDHSQTVCKTNSYNKRTRGARTERYIKRLFKEETYADDGNQISCKRNSLDNFEEGQRVVANSNEATRSGTHPGRSSTQSNNYTISTHKPVILNPQDVITNTRIIENRAYSSHGEYSTQRHFTDMNQNNFCEKNAINSWLDEEPNNRFGQLTVAKNIDNQEDRILEQRTIPRSPNPPDPPPRDPRRVPTYAYHSFPFNGRGQKKRHLDGYANSNTDQRLDWFGVRAYSSSEEIARSDVIKVEPRYVPRFESNKTNVRSQEYANNKYRSMYNNRSNEINRNASQSRQLDELEASKCRRKNNRNNQLSLNVNEREEGAKQIELSSNCETDGIYGRIMTRNAGSSCEHKKNLQTNLNGNEVNGENENEESIKMEEEARERKRSSKNLEEAISELEAIYNSLRLGDEDLLDRAERRSMEEFSLKHGQVEDEPAAKPNRSDSPDRLKDDMAYRRMHPVERPTSLSDIIGQSLLSNISYLIASPVLSRRDNALDEPTTTSNATRRDEPDVTRDDVVFRSIHRANNTLKVVEPQPPFGIPLGPVTGATESDYLHTVPNKSNPPRSPYIPQCEPDIVTDDLAFRTLRKDAPSSVKTNSDNQTDGTNEPVNSEFHKQPSLREINDDIQSIDGGSSKFLEKTNHFRRVVSDGELSDQGNVRWRGERFTKKATFDINGNHPDSGLCRKMLRVYVSPSTTMQWSPKDSKSREDTPTSTFASATRRTSSGDIVGQDLWKSNREGSSPGKENTDSDFTAYSRLCQDLVDIIKGNDDPDVNINERKEVLESKNSQRESKIEIEPLITELRNELLGDIERPERSTESLTSEAKRTEIDDCVDLKLDEVNNAETLNDKLDYYLRLANENVKMIEEAFSSVVDHLRHGLDVGDDSSSHPRTDSDIGQETSPRSSSLLVEIDENERSQEESSSTSLKKEFSENSHTKITPKNSTESDVSVEKFEVPSTKETNPKRRSDIEVDLNKAVEDLQLAAASLSGSVQEMEELEVTLAKLNEDRLFIDEERKSSEKNEEECKLFIVEKKDVEEVAPESGVERGGEKREEEESSMSKTLDVQDGNGRVVAVREGEKNVYEVVECTAYRENQQLARVMEMRVPYVTNIITIAITEYFMVLLACLLLYCF